MIFETAIDNLSWYVSEGISTFMEVKWMDSLSSISLGKDGSSTGFFSRFSSRSATKLDIEV
ncbi:hypothetical protein HMI54_015679 [Coelomomyces lativittatus]|nr:hypothetical protein HMI54_015679 [Coelomomyces lativittatus]